MLDRVASGPGIEGFIGRWIPSEFDIADAARTILTPFVRPRPRPTTAHAPTSGSPTEAVAATAACIAADAASVVAPAIKPTCVPGETHSEKQLFTQACRRQSVEQPPPWRVPARPQGTLVSGVRVRLHSLKSRPELNGRLAIVQFFNEENGRWNVELECNGEGLALRMEALEIVDDDR